MPSQTNHNSLVDLLVPEAVNCDLQAASKDAVLDELCGLLVSGRMIQDKGQALKAVQERETLGSTGCGSGVAVPHARFPGLERTAVAVGISKAGLDYGAVDGERVHLFFLLLGPASSPEAYLKVLSQIARLVKEAEFREGLKSCRAAADVIALVRSHSV